MQSSLNSQLPPNFTQPASNNKLESTTENSATDEVASEVKSTYSETDNLGINIDTNA